MLLELILIGILIFTVLTFFYKQTICEFRLNQIEWNQQEKIGDLFIERVPIVVRGRPQTAFWTQEDVLIRESYAMVPIFEDRILSDWLLQAQPNAICPWKKEHARLLALRNISGLALWSDKVLNPVMYASNPLLKLWLRPISSCWAGEKGLWKTIASWTTIFVTQGSIIVTILTANYENSLPSIWQDTFPSKLTVHDTPFIGDLKYMDIILRPGNILFMPAHWFVSWSHYTSDNTDAICPMVCTVEYHSPISRFAEWSSNNT